MKLGWSSIDVVRVFGATAIALSTAVLFPVVSGAAPTSAPPTIGSCSIFPANNVWNTPIDTLPVHPQSSAWITSIGSSTGLKADFGSGRYEGVDIGIPYTTAPGTQPPVNISFDYDEESDPGPYRLPPDAVVEGGSDNHVIVVDRDNCMLTEIFEVNKESATVWTGGSGAIFNLNSNDLRPDTWTSADAAGLPILPGLARYDEIAAGEIAHALRFTAVRTQKAYLWPARHYASDDTSPNLPPMGARVRLKANVDISGYPAEVRVILRALQRYGMFLADNGSDWFVSGAPDERWNNDNLRQLQNIIGANLEFVDESSLMVRPDSGEARVQTGASVPAPAAVQPQPQPPAQTQPEPQPPALRGAACDLQAEIVICPNAMLAGADLSGLYLDGADLRGANLRGANLRTTILTNANLEGADLTDANLNTATLTGARLTNAILVRADFTEADTGEVDFTGATYGETICNDGHVTDGPPC